MTGPMGTSTPLAPAATTCPRASMRAGGPSNARFAVAALGTSLVNLALHAAAHFLFLRDVYRAHPPGSEAFARQLSRAPDQLVVWAMVLTSVTMGLLIATVMRWSRATTLGAGLRCAAVLGLLFWSAVNSGLYASSHFFSLPGALVDTLSSALCMTLAGTSAVWMMHGARRSCSAETADRVDGPVHGTTYDARERPAGA
jgi:hypothetical protein